VLAGNLVWLGSYATCKTIPDAHYCLSPDVTVTVKTGNKTTVCIDNLSERQIICKSHPSSLFKSTVELPEVAEIISLY